MGEDHADMDPLGIFIKMHTCCFWNGFRRCSRVGLLPRCRSFPSSPFRNYMGLLTSRNHEDLIGILMGTAFGG